MFHVGEKLYSCRYCAKKFTTSNHIKKHEGVHRFEKSRAATRRLPLACTCLPKIYPGGPEKYIMQQLLQLKKKRRKNNVDYLKQRIWYQEFTMLKISTYLGSKFRTNRSKKIDFFYDVWKKVSFYCLKLSFYNKCQKYELIL